MYVHALTLILLHNTCTCSRVVTVTIVILTAIAIGTLTMCVGGDGDGSVCSDAIRPLSLLFLLSLLPLLPLGHICESHVSLFHRNRVQLSV